MLYLSVPVPPLKLEIPLVNLRPFQTTYSIVRFFSSFFLYQLLLSNELTGSTLTENLGKELFRLIKLKVREKLVEVVRNIPCTLNAAEEYADGDLGEKTG